MPQGRTRARIDVTIYVYIFMLMFLSLVQKIHEKDINQLKIYITTIRQ